MSLNPTASETHTLTVTDPGVPTTFATGVLQWHREHGLLWMTFVERKQAGDSANLLVVARMAVPVTQLDSLIHMLTDAKEKLGLADAPTGVAN